VKEERLDRKGGNTHATDNIQPPPAREAVDTVQVLIHSSLQVTTEGRTERCRLRRQTGQTPKTLATVKDISDEGSETEYLGH